MFSSVCAPAQAVSDTLAMTFYSSMSTHTATDGWHGWLINDHCLKVESHNEGVGVNYQHVNGYAESFLFFFLTEDFLFHILTRNPAQTLTTADSYYSGFFCGLSGMH